MHGHSLIYVLKNNFDVIERMFDVFDKRQIGFKEIEDRDVAMQAAAIGGTLDDLRNAILYALKQHRWGGPGFDGAGSRRRFGSLQAIRSEASG